MHEETGARVDGEAGHRIDARRRRRIGDLGRGFDERPTGLRLLDHLGPGLGGQRGRELAGNGLHGYGERRGRDR
ncbi:hypothetical protein FQ377_06205 [Arthrobacter echini]|uniref:Uncharacterized protein n=1 Tax=Arthrobacter echini TaxID=1529066 RepID=A0A5D0XUI9_9MICC|nr:hypothetical protein FQ377_06205 [Arthrobacter echini]